MDNKKRIGINMIAQIISFVINIGINFFLTPFVTEHVGKEVYGFVSLAFQTTGYVTVITTALNAMLGRYVTIKLSQKDYDSANKYFTSVAIANLAISVLLILPSALIIIFLEHIIQVPTQYVLDVKILWAFIFASFLLGLSTECFGVSTYASNRLDLSAKRTMESNVLKVIILVSCYMLFIPKVWFIGMANLTCGFLVIITNIIYKKKLTPELKIDRKYFDWKAVWELVSIGTWNSVNQVAQQLINGLDLIITNLFVGAAEMTLMGFAKSMPSYIMQLISIISSSFGPHMTLTYAKGDMKEFVRTTKSAIKICGFICSVPLLGFVAFGMDFFSLWLRTLTHSEVVTVQILSVMTLFYTMFDVYIFPIYTVNTITCKLKIPVLVNVGIGIGNVIGTLILLKYTNLGIYSVQLVSSTLLSLRVFFFAPIYAAHTLNQKWTTFYGPLLRGMVSSGIILTIFFGIVSIVDITSWIRLVPTALLCGVIGYCVNYVVVLDREERVKVKEMVMKKIRK